MKTFFRTRSARVVTALVVTVLTLFFFSQGAKAQSTDLTGIAHIALRVNDLDKSRDFYHKLGFEQGFEFSDNGKISVAYLKVNDRQFIELIPRTSHSQPGGILHTCFEVADIESLHKTYLEKGLQPTEPKKGRAGNLLFVMHGPDNQLLEYTQYMPESLHTLSRGNYLGDRVSTHMLEATTPVKDLNGERSYYVEKLGFKSTNAGGNQIYVTGNSGDKVELQADSPEAKPRVVFTVVNVKQASRELRKRGFKVQKERQGIFVTDPNGTILVFAVAQ